MKKTLEIIAGFIMLGFMVFVFWQLVSPKQVDEVIVYTDDQTQPLEYEVKELKSAMEGKFIAEVGQPIEGFEPQMFMQVFPGLESVDFDRVEALIGKYVYVEGQLQHQIEDSEMIHSAAPAISEQGMVTLMKNISTRLQLDVESDFITDKILAEISKEEEKSTDIEPVACTMDAKMCPDGSFVGRTGPDCEFAECVVAEKREKPKSITCSPESKLAQACTMEYSPVCGVTNIQCVTTPCNPIEETFSNGCMACAEDGVNSYTEGVCEADLQTNY